MAATISRVVLSRAAFSGDPTAVRHGNQPASACAPDPGAAARPHLLETLEGAGLGTEDVDDDGARVDQHPVAQRHASAPDRAVAPPVQVLEPAIRDRAD